MNCNVGDLRNGQCVIIAVLFSMTVMSTAHAQRPVYLCQGTYTDKPCKDGREVDIAPTRGAHSMSGTKKEGWDAMRERVNEEMLAATKKGYAEGAAAMRCYHLQQERQAIDRLGAQQSGDRRYKIRQEQFKLGCKQT